MKEFVGQNGGRYTYIDDITNLQDLSLAFGEIFSECDNFVVSGCEINGTSISEGYVYINGKIRKFAGTSAVTSFPTYIYELNSVANVSYVDSTDKPGRTIYSCTIGSSVPSKKDAVTGAIPQFIKFTSTYRSGVKEAFFGKYALLLNPTATKQIVEKPVDFNGIVSLNGGLNAADKYQLTKGSSIFTIQYDSNNNLIMQSKLGDLSPFKLMITPEGYLEYYIGATKCMSIDENGISLSGKTQSGAETIQGGSIILKESDIYNDGASNDSGSITINRIGYGGQTSYYRNFAIYNGKGGKMAQFTGASGNIEMYSNIVHTSDSSIPIALCSTSKTKTDVSLIKKIIWKDSNSEEIASVGYVSSENNSFSIVNSIGDIIIKANGALKVSGNIYESGQSLSDKYALKSELSSALEVKVGADSIYTKTACDDKFIAFSGGINSLINYMSGHGDSDPAGTIRNLLKVYSTEQCANGFISKSDYMSAFNNYYTSNTIDQRFVPLSGSLNAIMNFMRTQGDSDPAKSLRNTLSVLSASEVSSNYAAKGMYLSDMATDSVKKAQICNNIGAAIASETQSKLKSVSWTRLGSTNLYARQVGNVVSICGTVAYPSSGNLFELPSTIDPPAYECVFSLPHMASNVDHNRGIRVKMSGGSRVATVAENTWGSITETFTLTYLI